MRFNSFRPMAKIARRRWLLPLIVLLALSQVGYIILTGLERQPLSWNPQKRPVQFHLWQGFDDDLPWVIKGSQLKLAIREALHEWVQVSSIPVRLTETPQSRAGQDGLNLITIADTPENNNLVAGRLAVALIWGRPREIIEADVVFNPKARDPWSTIDQRGALNLYDVAIHEFGHSLGLEHSIARSSRMFFQGGGFTFGLRGVSYDDFAGINLLYPLPGIELITGAITGRVMREGQPVFGAFVVVADENGTLAANAITRHDGTYRVDRLPPGRYSVYAEPLDGPTTPQNLSGSLFDPVTDVITDFLPAFYQGSLEPRVRVNAGGVTTGINLTVSRGSVEVDPVLLGVAEDLQKVVRVKSTPSSAVQGSSLSFVAGGGGVERLPENGAFELLGSLSTSGNVSKTMSSGSLTFKFFPMTVPETAPRGEYSALFHKGPQLGVVTGGIHVYSPFRFLQAFGQFAHLPGEAASQLFLLNLDPEHTAEGRVVGLSDGSSTGSLRLGGLAGDLQGRVDFQLAAAAATLSRSSGSSAYRGGVLAEATYPLGSAVLIETDFGTTGLSPGPALQAFTAPVEVSSGGSDADTGLALSNLDTRPVLIYLQAQDQQGNKVSQTIIELEAYEQTARFVRELLPGLPDNFRGSILATANRKIAASVIRTAPGVFTTFPVIQNRVAPRSVFPQFANSGSLRSELILVNPSPACEASAITVQVRDQSGSPAAVTFNGVFYPTGRILLDLPPLGSARLRSSQTEVVGWVEVSSSLPVGGVLLYQSTEVGTAGVGETALSPELVLPIDRDANRLIDLGIAIVNPQPQPVTVTLQARGENGFPVGSQRTLTLGAFQHIAQFPNQDRFDLNLPADFTGSLWLEADAPIAAAAIRQSPGVLTTLPSFDRRLPVAPPVE